MGQMVVFTQPKTVGIEEYADPPLGPGEVRLRTLYSGISAGTELTAYRGSNPYVHKQWDSGRRLFVAAEMPSQPYPLRGWGYEECGEVVEVGPAVSQVRLGDIVYGTWGHRTTYVTTEAWASQRLLPPGLDPILGIFSHIGPIALNGILDAGIRIGETVAIFGLGVPGQIVAQLAKHSGSRVIGVDLFDQRLALARSLGALDEAINPRQENAAERIKALTANRGADVSIEVSGALPALHEAIRATAYASRVVALGFFQGEARGLYLGEEFHHNRIHVVSSQIGGVAPELAHRWDRRRLIETIMRLQVEGVLKLRPLITAIYPLTQAAEAFRRLDEQPGDVLQIVLDMSG
jgi:threonine dehydrogenase-like Zn-dependent dehydrogenase